MSPREEKDVQREIVTELLWELGEEKAAAIVATVERGLAVLVGRVATSEERRNVVAAALRVDGVLGVVDALGVVVSGGPVAPNAALAREARRALETHVPGAARRIKTVVAKGWITLYGTVDHAADAHAAESALRRFTDARGVTSVVGVRFPGGDGLEVRRAVEASLEPRRVHVAECAGAVVLEGEVLSARDKEAVIAAAAHAARAVRLVDHLHVH
jgi:osmotically-inducible protein OsmY